MYVIIENNSNDDYHLNDNQIKAKCTYTLPLNKGNYKLKNSHKTLKFKVSNGVQVKSNSKKLCVSSQESYYTAYGLNTGDSLTDVTVYTPTERVYTPLNNKIVIN